MNLAGWYSVAILCTHVTFQKEKKLHLTQLKVSWCLCSLCQNLRSTPSLSKLKRSLSNRLKNMHIHEKWDSSLLSGYSSTWIVFSLWSLLDASINFSSAHPSGQPRGICSRCQSWGSQLYRGPGAGHWRNPGRPPGIWQNCFRKKDEFIGKDEAFVKTKASRRRKQ